MYSIAFFPKRFCLAVDVNGCPESTHDFLRSRFLKYIYILSEVTIQCKKSLSFMLRKQNVTHRFSLFHLPVVQLMSYPFSCLLDIFYGVQTIINDSAINIQPLCHLSLSLRNVFSNNACDSASSNFFRS